MEDDYEYYQTPDFVGAYRDNERVTMRKFEIVGDKKLQRVQNMLNYADIEEMILSEITFFALHLQTNGVLAEDEVITITNKYSVVPQAKYKNPIAFVLGYVATRGTRAITNFEEAKHELDVLKDPSVTDVDILRYARLWISLV
jgi:hypothetical protein